MSIAHSPLVSPVDPASAPEIVTILNGWRDAMPAVELDDGHQVYALTLDEQTVGGYVMTNIGPANEILLLAIDPARRRHGYGRMCCMDALFRSGKRPVVLNSDEAAVGFAKAVGFKIVGKRRGADGGAMFRLGWHAPRPTADPSSRSGC